MSLEIFVDAIATKFECDKAELRAIVQKAMVDAKFLDDTPVAPVVNEKKGSKGSPTIYSQFISYWNVQLRSQYADYKIRQKTYIQMWNALSPAEKKAWVVPGGVPVMVTTQRTATRRQTGYMLFISRMKTSPEVLEVASGPQRSKKLGAMWQALKGVPVEGQDYWNQMAKEDDVDVDVPTTEQLPVVVTPVIAAIVDEEDEEDEEDDESEIDEESEDD
jgi:hypothetical protein